MSDATYISIMAANLDKPMILLYCFNTLASIGSWCDYKFFFFKHRNPNEFYLMQCQI